MKQNSDILEKVRRNDGMTVPEGYFADFSRQMAASLPERPEIEQPAAAFAEAARRTLWQRVRPYAYMAAMFAGIWMMLQLFTIITNPGDLRPIDSNPVMAEALGNDAFILDYIVDDAGMDQWDVIDEMVEDGTIEVADFSGLADPADVSSSLDEE